MPRRPRRVGPLLAVIWTHPYTGEQRFMDPRDVSYSYAPHVSVWARLRYRVRLRMAQHRLRRQWTGQAAVTPRSRS